MAVRFTPGGVLRVPLPDDDVAHAVMLAVSPYVAFYGGEEGFAENRLPDRPPLFVLAVQKNAYSTGGWGSILFRVREADLPEIPLFYRQDAMRPQDCEIVNARGATRKATPAECAGLERSAVWAAPHVESRLSDHFANRPNAFVESMKLKP
ncbi:hypothetical protein [Dactylosporangium sp. NPDC048998]|uniref:hypothetical protein n=1 Tax=Dactylosporangium sp. NPDC048998 TaxID=3363976 RepID=UPI00371B95B1